MNRRFLLMPVMLAFAVAMLHAGIAISAGFTSRPAARADIEPLWQSETAPPCSDHSTSTHTACGIHCPAGIQSGTSGWLLLAAPRKLTLLVVIIGVEDASGSVEDRPPIDVAYA